MSRKQLELDLALPPDQVTVVYGPQVVHVPATLRAGYYPGEDAGKQPTPFKLGFHLGLNSLMEFSLSEVQASQVLLHLSYWLKKRTRGVVPHSISDV